MKRWITLLALIALASASTLAQTVQWEETSIGGLVATDDDYYYNIKTTLGSISGRMFTVTNMTRDRTGEGISAFCTEYVNLGRMGTTLLVEKREWNVYMPAADFKRKQVSDSLKKGTASDLAFAMSYGCLDVTEQRRGQTHTLYIPDGSTFMLPYPTSNLKMTFTGKSDGRIETTIVR